MDMKTQTSGIRKACEYVGGVSALAQRLDITSSAVSQWVNGLRRVPAEQCPKIERITAGKVRCENLRPDIEWAVLRSHGEDAA